MPKSAPFLFVNGVLCPVSAPAIRADDAGFLHAWGAFETLRLTAGRLVARSRHAARLRATLEHLHIVSDISVAFEQVERLIDANGIRGEGRARVTITGGVAGEPTVVVQAEAMPGRIGRRRAGLGCMPRAAPRPLAGHKTLAWLGPRLALATVSEDEEPLVCSDLEVLEGATSNVFCATPTGVVTPPADGRILPGIARAVLIEALAHLGIPCRIERLTLDTLARHGGVLTNALLPIAPIRAVDGRATPAVPWLAAAREVFDEVAG